MASKLIAVLHADGDLAGIARVDYEGGNWKIYLDKAVRKFRATEDGKRVLHDNDGWFNFGDVMVSLPREFMEAEGIYEVEWVNDVELIQHDDQWGEG